MKLHTYLFIILAWASLELTYSQEPDKADSSLFNKDTLLLKDSLSSDSLKLEKKEKKKTDFNSKIVYSAKDSMRYSAINKKLYLYGDAKVEYEDIILKAAYFEYDFTTNTIFAKGVPKDTLSDKLEGVPDFSKGNNKFIADSMLYNFKTQKGKTFQTNTKEGDGFLKANITKKRSDGTFNIKGGLYTTCDAEHPHFGIKLSKAVIIPDNKVVSGPAYFVFEDVPIYPFFIPFGFFPSKRNGASGVKIPSYGENSELGFYLKDGGYYFIINDYMDLEVTGDIYSRGTWGVSGRSSYSKRYKFSGNFNLRYYENKTGDKGLDLSKSRDFNISWSHTQDPKANPTRSFSANVNYSSSSFDKNHNYLNRESLTQNTKSSSISYNKSWKDMNLSANLRHSQSSSTKMVQMTLPSLNFNLNKYPFRTGTSTGKWYDNIQLRYTAQLENSINANEDEVFTKKSLDNAQNGFKHSLPLSVNFKFLKYFNFSPSMTYSGVLYSKQYMKSWENGAVKTDTIHKFSYAHGFAPSASLSFNPTIFGMAVFKKEAKIQAIRHAMIPSISFGFTPDVRKLLPNYYRSYTRITPTDTSQVIYSIYDGNIYGTPTPSPIGSGRSGSINFSLNNNLAMKVKSEKDTVKGVKVINIIETLNFATSYNIYAKEYNLSPIRINGSTKLFKDFGVIFNGVVNPYDTDSTGATINRYYWKKHKGIGRLTNAGFSFGYTFKSSEGAKKEDNNNLTSTTEDGETVSKPQKEYTYFDIPWSLNFSYSFTYSKILKTKNIVQSLNFGGSIALTKKWNIGFQSGYDFQAKQFSYTTFNISRNLHCWVMTFDCAPFGQFRFYNFRISALSSLLNDLKYETRKDYYDYNYNQY